MTEKLDSPFPIATRIFTVFIAALAKTYTYKKIKAPWKPIFLLKHFPNWNIQNKNSETDEVFGEKSYAIDVMTKEVGT